MKEKLKLNKGFTLVELLISVAVLAVIVVPLSSLYFSTSKMTLAAQDLSSATLIAKNIAEELETIDFRYWNSIDNKPYVTDSADNVEIGGRFVTKNSDGIYETMSPQPSVAPKDGFSVEFIDVKDRYNRYNAVVTFEPNKAFNEKELFVNQKIDFIDTSLIEHQEIMWNAFLRLSQVEGFELRVDDDSNEFLQSSQNEYLDSLEEQTRLTEIDISQVDDEIIVELESNITYFYPDTLPDGTGYSGPEKYPLSDFPLTKTYSFEYFAEEDPVSIYFMMDPFYSGLDRASNDKVIINNLQNIPITIGLIKQESEFTSFAREEFYDFTINLYENDISVLDTEIITNFDKNIDENASDDKIDITLSSHHPIYATSKGKLTTRSLTEKYSSDRLYDVKIEIFEQNQDGSTNYLEPIQSEIETTIVK